VKSQPPTMYLRQAGLTRNPTFRIFNAFGVGDEARLRKPRSNANTHVGSNKSGQILPMTEDKEIELKCEHCGADNLDSFVNGGSYIFKCLTCKKDGPATSFRSISKDLHGQYELIEVDQDLTRRETLWTGEIKEGIDRIQLETSKGKLIWLKKVV